MQCDRSLIASLPIIAITDLLEETRLPCKDVGMDAPREAVELDCEIGVVVQGVLEAKSRQWTEQSLSRTRTIVVLPHFRVSLGKPWLD